MGRRPEVPPPTTAVVHRCGVVGPGNTIYTVYDEWVSVADVRTPALVDPGDGDALRDLLDRARGRAVHDRKYVGRLRDMRPALVTLSVAPLPPIAKKKGDRTRG